MGATYKWLGESGERRLVVMNTVTRESIEIPKSQGVAAIMATIESARGNTAGSVDVDEFVVAKVVADKNGRIDEIRTWATGGNRGSIIAELNAAMGKKDAVIDEQAARLAELQAKLDAAGIA